MERLRSTQKPKGIHAGALRTWGLFFLTAGMIGRGIVQNQILGIGEVSAQQLLETMQSSQWAMMLATLSLVLQAMETCAVPIYALLVVEGFRHTSSLKQYLLRVTGVALLSEIPYNLVMSGKILDLSSRNPVVGVVLSLAVLYFYRTYAKKSMINVLIKIVVTASAVLWTQMLGVDSGAGLVIVVCVLWIFRKNPLYRTFAGAIATIVCTLISPFYLAAPMGFLAVHMYNGEQGADNRVVNYLAYPVLALALGLIGIFLF